MEPKVNNWEFCKKPEIVVHETDLLLIGGGMAACGTAYEADRWATPEGLRITMVDKAATDRSGAVAMGLSAIAVQWPWDFPQLIPTLAKTVLKTMYVMSAMT